MFLKIVFCAEQLKVQHSSSAVRSLIVRFFSLLTSRHQ